MIEGKLVNLRAPDMDDLERNHGWINDREVTRFLSMRYEIALAAEAEWMRGIAGKPMTFANVFFAIQTKDGRHIGNTNFFNTSPENRNAEIGIMIGDKAYWSQGYGSDALKTLIAFGFEEMNLYRQQLDVFSFNDRAIACYRKCGFVEEVRKREDLYQDGAYHDVLRMGLLREEWEARR